MASSFVEVDGLRIHYREEGTGDVVLLLHGWPTSSFLYRNIIGKVGETHRTIAIDLPGFGASDKPLDASYSFGFYAGVLEGFLDALGVKTVALVVHDLGGPVGLWWACEHPARISKLVLLNTLVYPMPSWAVVAFFMACRIPGLRGIMVSDWGLKIAMKIGVTDFDKLGPEVVPGVQEPFQTKAARKALLKAGIGLHPGGFRTIAEKLPSFEVPVRIIYGARDRILPDVARTMTRVAKDLPQATTTVLDDCGHFLQEERPAEIAEHLAEFLASP
jgi:haloalkane dehalogenase